MEYFLTNALYFYSHPIIHSCIEFDSSLISGTSYTFRMTLFSR